MISCIKENYQSRFSGTEFDERLALAHTALQGIIANGERLLPIEGVVTLNYATDEEIEALKTAMNALLAIVETKANKDALEALSGRVDALATSSATKAEVAVLAAKIDSAIIAIQGKQDKLIAGDNITIENNIISATADVKEIRKHTHVLTVDCEARILDYCTSIEDLSEKYALINVIYISDNKNLIGASILPSNDVEKGWLYEYMTGWRLCKVGGFSISDTSTFADLANYLDAHSDNIVSRALTGDPADLKTTFKSNLVGAINEVKDTMDARYVVLNIKLGAITPEGTIITNAAKIFGQVYNAPEDASFYIPDPQKPGKISRASILWEVRGVYLQIYVYEGAVTKLYQIMQDVSTSRYIGVYTEENPLLTKADKTDVQTLQEEINRIEPDASHAAKALGAYPDRPSITIVPDKVNKAVNAAGAIVDKSGWAVSSLIRAIKGNEYLFAPGVTDGDVCVFAEYVAYTETRTISYTYTYNEDGLIVGASAAYNGVLHSYTFTYDSEEEGGAQHIWENGVEIPALPSIFVASAGSYIPITKLNANAELPSDGKCRFIALPKDMDIVVCYKVGEANLTMEVLRDGIFANIATQIGNTSQKIDETNKKMADINQSIEDNTARISDNSVLLGLPRVRELSVDAPLKVCDAPAILYGAGAPSAAITPANWDVATMGQWVGIPNFVGQLYINTSAGSSGLYYAINDSAVSGWKQA